MSMLTLRLAMMRATLARSSLLTVLFTKPPAKPPNPAPQVCSHVCACTDTIAESRPSSTGYKLMHAQFPSTTTLQSPSTRLSRTLDASSSSQTTSHHGTT